jgi:hypothetical protein
MTASDYQRATKVSLERLFPDAVHLEWRAVSGAKDALSPDAARYAPRVDIAVGPFNLTPGPQSAIDLLLIPERIRGLFAGRPGNPNPRCLLAIEVIFSGTSKHVMGDILNAAALGLFGFVVGSDREIDKVKRNFAYLDTVTQLGKLPPLFRNVLALSTTDFDQLLANA